MHYYENQELANVLDQAVTEPNEEDRIELFHEAQEMIVKQRTNLFVANPPYRIGLNQNVSGWKFYGLLGWDQNSYRLARSGDGRAK
jgi:peptide/nickel transport system substrate-binding protein